MGRDIQREPRVGNRVSDYTNGWPDLPGVSTDIKQVSDALEAQGFIVEKITDPNGSELKEAFNSFISRYGRADGNRLLFYFAGHGYTRAMSYGDEMGLHCPVRCS